MFPDQDHAIDTSEKNFEATIEEALLTQGYRKRTSGHFDRTLCLDEEVLVDFLRATQPKTWDKLKVQYPGGEHRSALLQRIRNRITQRGTVEVLRKGVSDRGCHFDLAYFRPETSLNEEHARLYRANQLTVVRQLAYRTKPRSKRKTEVEDGLLDMALFLNGLPLFTIELKVAPATVKTAIVQYKNDRDASEPLFAFKRCLAHFAMDTDLVYLTTRLRKRSEKEETVFLPFNRGRDQGAGNQPSKTDFPVAYMWRDVWTKDSILELVKQFIHVVDDDKIDAKGRKKKAKKLIFPRYHQRAAVRRLVADARRKGPGQRYLVQHSAGSGKSNTIAWLAHRLSSLHDDHDEPVFNTVIVITDRRILDRQLQSTVKSFEQKPGVVENIDKRSRQLGEAIEDGKKIIVTTLQKFPVIDADVRAMADRRFAVIIDEAHSSQSGESSKSVKKVLSWATLEEAAKGESGAPETMEDRIEAEMRARGPVPNVSLFAFTATPKRKTLETFGVEKTDGTFEAISLYSMRQAIEEKFILDVLENYTTYRSYWRLLKTIEADPHYEQSKAKGLLKQMVELDDHAIDAKVAVIVDHFESAVRPRIGGEAKAMLVTRSRLHAVRYVQAMRQELEKRKLPHRALVAFSDVLTADGEKHTEASLNGVSETQTAATFNRPECRFLVVAEKFQTGFDQPLLHTMYVDKKLAGVHAVQTLSRLNRTHAGKNETIVLDFANETDEIQDAFKEYYERTILSEATEPNLLYDVRDDLEGFGVYGPADVDELAAIFFRPAATTKAVDKRHAEAIARLAPIVEAFEDLDEDEQGSFRKKLRRYTRLYGFLSQVVTFEDARLEKLYVFAAMLLRRLPADSSELPTEVIDAVDMESYRLAKTAEGKIAMPGGPATLDPDGGGEHPSTDDPLKPLSEIVGELNRLHGFEGNGATAVSLGHVFQQIEDDMAIDSAVQHNTPENAKLTFDRRAEDHFEDFAEENFRLYKRTVDDPAFGETLRQLLYDRYVASSDFLTELIAQGEGATLELKSTLRYDLKQGAVDPSVVTHAVLKTIAAFANTNGGRLLIGVADDGAVLGIETDGFENNDKFLLHLVQVVGAALGERTGTCLDPRTKALGGKTVCLVQCERSPEPVFLKWRKTNKDPAGDFFVRTGPRTIRLPPASARQHIVTRFGEEALASSPLVPTEPAKKTPPKKQAVDAALLFRRVKPGEGERFKTCLPLLELEAAAGELSESQTLDHGVLEEAPEWVELVKPPGRIKKLEPGMFVAQVRGRSMEPKIPDGAHCVFRSPVTGTRQGRVVLATARDFTDPEHGGRYTVKIYNSTKRAAEDGGWTHEQVVLRPANKAEFEPLELGPNDNVAVLAELVAVLG